ESKILLGHSHLLANNFIGRCKRCQARPLDSVYRPNWNLDKGHAANLTPFSRREAIAALTALTEICRASAISVVFTLVCPSARSARICPYTAFSIIALERAGLRASGPSTTI